jgi:hypothetical protein
MGSIGNCLREGGTFYGVKIYLSDTRYYNIWGQYGRVCYKTGPYMGSVRSCLIQGGTLCVNMYLYDKRWNILWGQ